MSDAAAAYRKKLYATDKYRAYIRAYRLEEWRRLRKELITLYGGKCTECGYDKDIRALQLDHVPGDGHKKRKLGWQERGIGLYRRLVKLGKRQPGFQLLCANCNFIKATENKEFGVRNA